MKPCFPGRRHRRSEGPRHPCHSDDDDHGQNKRVPNTLWHELSGGQVRQKFTGRGSRVSRCSGNSERSAGLGDRIRLCLDRRVGGRPEDIGRTDNPAGASV
jgi:hypothetical protein